MPQNKIIILWQNLYTKSNRNLKFVLIVNDCSLWPPLKTKSEVSKAVLDIVKESEGRDPENTNRSGQRIL